MFLSLFKDITEIHFSSASTSGMLIRKKYLFVLKYFSQIFKIIIDKSILNIVINQGYKVYNQLNAVNDDVI